MSLFIQRYKKKTGSVEDAQPSGRKAILFQDDVNFIDEKMKVNDELTSSELQKLLRDERNVSSIKQNVRRKIDWRHEMTRIMKSLIKLDFLRFGILNSRYDWLDMIFKISLGHKKLKTRKRTKMKCSAGCCSFEYHTYISVTPNIDFRSCYERCVHQTQFLAGRKTRAARTQDAGSSDARRERCGRKTRALWTQDAGAVDARRGQTQR